MYMYNVPVIRGTIEELRSLIVAVNSLGLLDCEGNRATLMMNDGELKLLTTLVHVTRKLPIHVEIIEELYKASRRASAPNSAAK
jgi:hypothetical protein